MTYDEIKSSNGIIFDRLALLLNNKPDLITAEMVRELTENYGLTVENAYSLLLAILHPMSRSHPRRLFFDP